ncbi:MAG: sensor histidine kinase [Oscillospiraceae bacterium]|nr:sensor histidine kinase [Oscillospiraceae bacterium]
MEEMEAKRPRSLRTGLVATIISCWVLPIIIIVILAGVLLDANYEHSVRQELSAESENALEQLEMRFHAAFEASKSVSYDGVVRNAYRLYQQDGDNAAFYRTATEYLSQTFSRDERVRAVFLSFWEDIGVHPYYTANQTHGSNTITSYRSGTEQAVLEAMRDADTGIVLMEREGELYILRNLLDSHFSPYATVVMLCDSDVLFQSMEPVWRLGDAALTLDDSLVLRSDGTFHEADPDDASPADGLQCTTTIESHTFRIDAAVRSYNIWREMPNLRVAVLIVVLMGLPMLLIMIHAFRRLVTQPVETLVDATSKIQDGARGYVIEETARSREFQKLYRHFNAMSAELKSQFERSYREQQALQQAKMKALQSQINPHFLNNTLEIINWEARIAENDRVSAMIEALSTMLDAALDRDGRSQVHLREELSYVDAYLYIIKERLGDRLETVSETDETLMDAMVPRLILQPLVENAVEYDLTPRRGGKVCVRTYREGARMVLEVEHDGALSPEDLVNLEHLLHTPLDTGEIAAKVGLRNVRERLWLTYGEAGTLTVEQTGPDTILARVMFPVLA